MYCPNCGKIYESKLNLKICEYCGEDLSIRDDIDVKQSDMRKYLGIPEPPLPKPFINEKAYEQLYPFLTYKEARDMIGLPPFVNDNLMASVNPDSNMALFMKAPPPNFEISTDNPFGEPKGKLKWM